MRRPPARPILLKIAEADRAPWSFGRRPRTRETRARSRGCRRPCPGSRCLARRLRSRACQGAFRARDSNLRTQHSCTLIVQSVFFISSIDILFTSTSGHSFNTSACSITFPNKITKTTHLQLKRHNVFRLLAKNHNTDSFAHLQQIIEHELYSVLSPSPPLLPVPPQRRRGVGNMIIAGAGRCQPAATLKACNPGMFFLLKGHASEHCQLDRKLYFQHRPLGVFGASCTRLQNDIEGLSLRLRAYDG